MNSLQVRLQIGLSIVLALFMIVLWWLSSTALNHISEQMVSSRLEHDGEALLASLEQTPEGQWQLKASQVGHIYQRIFSGHYYLITINGSPNSATPHKLRSRSLWDFQIDFTQPLLIGPENQPLLSWQKKFRINQQTITIWLAEDISPLHHSMDELNQLFAITGFVMWLALLFLLHWVIKYSMQSLNQISQELEALSEGDLTQLTSEVPNEIKPLVNEVNRLLQLIAQRLKRSRNAMGNLAHSLKHPLNLLMQQAEQQDDNSHLKQELVQHTKQIHHLLERELKRARIAGSGAPGQRFDAEEELPLLVDILQRVYHEKAIEITPLTSSPCEYHADRNDMLELLGNLLDNACKWANHHVNCQIKSQQGLQIVIEDDGKGCSDEELARLTERGVRIDESTQGSGLGLAIVKDIVELYNGQIIFNRSQLGGLQVTINLP